MDPRKIWLKSQAELQASLAVSSDKDKSYESAIISYMEAARMLLELNIPEHITTALLYTKRAAELREHLKRKRREGFLAKTPAQMEFARAKFLVLTAQECESQRQIADAIANYNDAARIFQGLVNNLATVKGNLIASDIKDQSSMLGRECSSRIAKLKSDLPSYGQLSNDLMAFTESGSDPSAPPLSIPFPAASASVPPASVPSASVPSAQQPAPQVEPSAPRPTTPKQPSPTAARSSISRDNSFSQSTRDYFLRRPLGNSLRDEGPSGGTGAASPSPALPNLPPVPTHELDDEDPYFGPPTIASPPDGPGGGEGYTKEEIAVLRETSCINGRYYLPFLHSDLNERFSLPIEFTDKDGPLKLSSKQQSRFSRWVRPSEIMDEPKVIANISCYSIKQTCVTDCSFIASLAICALYETTFNKTLIRRMIWPQDRHGNPVYNPCGKYMVRIELNGVPRKILIDDLLPVGRSGELLCSHSVNPNELWISLLEKAYLKVMGGYDFPGSNSNIDLHSLTGWIPDRIPIKDKYEDFNKDSIFQLLNRHYHQGNCLLTMATGAMSEEEAERAGLVPTHAYALLDIKEALGCRLFLLKNPWAHLRWKGNYSENDERHWTPEMQRAFNYDLETARAHDNGVFWVDYDSLINFFDVFYVNWNPELFPKQYCIHRQWPAQSGPKKDNYNISDNPQFLLDVTTTQMSTIYVLLTRHITDKEDFANNREFIALVVYKNNGKRVFIPSEPAPYIDGVRINSPHYLVKIKSIPAGTREKYTLVLTQYEKNNTINYTIRVYGTPQCQYTFAPIPDPYKFEELVVGEWKGECAGGCPNYPNTYRKNPIYQVNVDNNEVDNQLLIELRAPRQYSVGMEVVTVSVRRGQPSFEKMHSSPYRRGYCYMEFDHVVGGLYNVMLSTFRPGEEGPFLVNIWSSRPVTVARIQ